MDSTNIDPVISNLKFKYPNLAITIAGDDDRKTKDNPGRYHAEKAAAKYKCSAVFPKFPDGFALPGDDQPTDFNDLMVISGIEEVQRQLNGTSFTSSMEEPIMADTETTNSTGQTMPNKFGFQQLNSLLQVPTKTRWIIKKYLDAESLSVLFGEPGAMKSFVAIDIGLCAASGTDWHGAQIREQGSVFYIAGEGFLGLSRRLQAWVQAHDVAAEDIPFFVSNQSAQLLDDKSAFEVVSRIEELQQKHGKPILVIIDNLNRNFGSGDENSTEDMTAFINNVDIYVRSRFRCAVLIVHHSPLNDPKRARGASALRALFGWFKGEW